MFLLLKEGPVTKSLPFASDLSGGCHKLKRITMMLAHANQSVCECLCARHATKEFRILANWVDQFISEDILDLDLEFHGAALSSC